MRRRVILSIPRWFLIVGGTMKPPPDLERLSIEALGVYGCVFLPFAMGCDWVRGERRIICGYDELERHVRLSEQLFSRYGNSIRHIVIHTEYQAPIWPDEKFVEGYTRFTLRLVELAVVKCELKAVDVELHPGFSDPHGSRGSWSPIIEGMTRYIMRLHDVLKGYGLAFRIAVENRGSSVLRKPQAVADLCELMRFKRELEWRFKREGIDVEVGVIVDPMQLVGLKKRRYRDVKRAIDEALGESESMARNYGKYVHGIHAHWVNEGGKTHSPPPLNEVEIVIMRYSRIINHVIDAGGEAYVVPEITPMCIRRQETSYFVKGLMRVLDMA